MVSLKQTGFSGGIISPQVIGRTDQQKYPVGLRTCQNLWVTRYGTIENRPGSMFVGEVKDSSNPLRIVPFVFSQNVSYLLEVGNDYIRVWKDGVRVGVAGAAAYAGGTTYGIGDLVTSAGIVYRSLQAANVGNTPISSPAFWAAQTGNLLEILTTIGQASLSQLQYVQQNDIMTLVQQLIAPQQLLRYSDTKWAFQVFTLSASIAAPSGISVTAGRPAPTAGGPPTPTATGGNAALNKDRYIITAVYTLSDATIHVYPSVTATSTVGGADGANPVSLAWGTASGSPAGYSVYKLVGTNYRFITSTAAGTTSFSDNGSITPTEVLAISSDNVVQYDYVVTSVSSAAGDESLASSPASVTGLFIDTAAPNVISWAAVSGAASYKVYRGNSGVFSFIGSANTLSFSDIGYTPDITIQPPILLNIFQTANDYPAVVGTYQQRLGFANTINSPQTVNLSRVAIPTSFTVSTPVQDNDAVSFTIAGRQVQQVRALVDLGKLIIHTSNAEYVASGNAAGAITPLSISLVAQGSAGAGFVPPVVIGNTDLFVQEGATRLNDLRYEVQSFAFTGKDLTKFATDLFKGRTIVDMAWQKIPHSIVWCVLDNGQMVGLTYVREDEMWAWHLHEMTNGAFENVCVVTEGTEYTVYVIVRRTINGATKRYIERLASRECLDTVFYSDSYFLDCALTYDGRSTDASTVTATASAWSPTDTITLTASIPKFSAGDVGNQIVFQLIDASTGLVTDFVVFNILTYIGASQVSGQATRIVPAWAQASAITTWGKAVDQFSGLGHLEGQSIGILADGNVAADPLDASYPVVTVIAGAFTLSKPALVVTAGLPIDMRGQTLPVENGQGETIANKMVSVKEATPIFYNSRGGSFGQDFNHLKPWKQPNQPANGYPIPPFSGPAYPRIPISGSPQTTGQICFRQTNPLPFAMSAVVVSGEVGN